MPVYNEQATILEIIKKVDSIKIPDVEKELIIVDDGSTDGTREILQGIKNHKVIFHEKNKGKSGAIFTGMENITGEIFLIQDADLEYNPEDYKTLLQAYKQGDADAVYSSRLGLKKHKYMLHFIGNRFLTLLTNLLYRTNVEDLECGYKIFKTDILKKMKINAKGFDFDPEVTAKLLKKGYKIKQVPISFNPRGFEEGKKIKWYKDGISAAWCLIKYRFKD